MKAQLDEVSDKMSSIRRQAVKDSKALNDQFACENPLLLEKLFGHFLETVAVHFDDVWTLLLDELLEEEVMELNKLEITRSMSSN